MARVSPKIVQKQSAESAGFSSFSFFFLKYIMQLLGQCCIISLKGINEGIMTSALPPASLISVL